MNTLKWHWIALVFSTCLVYLTSCAGSPAAPTKKVATEKPTIVTATTIVPTVLPIHTPLPTHTAVATIVSVPTSVLTATYILTDSHLTDKQITTFLAQSHPQVALFDIVVSQQSIDVNGDGCNEILVTGESTPWFLFYAILSRVNNVWREWFYEEIPGHYCAKIRSNVKGDIVVTDILTCSGGTGLLEVKWKQEWVRCRGNQCHLVWSTPIWNTSSLDVPVLPPYDERQYAISQIERPDPNTIRVTTHNFGNLILILPPTQEPISVTVNLSNVARRIIGPDILDVYRWNGNVFQQESHEQINSGQVILNEFDERTGETIQQVNQILSAPFEKGDGRFDSEGFIRAATEFWGPSAGVTWGRWWEQPYADVANHNGKLSQLGDKIAAVMRVSNDRPICRLTVQSYNLGKFSFVGQTELPCTSNFTRLAWADITGDGHDDLLLLTLPPDVEADETGAGLQRLYVYDVSNGLKQIAILDGAINGSDGAGIYWKKSDNGQVEVWAGIPLMPLTLSNTPWPNFDRRFQVYRWDMQSQKLVPGVIEALH